PGSRRRARHARPRCATRSDGQSRPTAIENCNGQGGNVYSPPTPPVLRFVPTARQCRLASRRQRGDGVGDAAMEARIARLESDVGHIRSDISEMKADIRSLRDKVDATSTKLSEKIEASGSGPHSLDSAAADVRWNLRANVMLPKTETESQHRTRSA